MSKQTAMQELLEWVRATFPMDLDTPLMIECKIESMIEKEKQQISHAYNSGGSDYCIAGWCPDTEEVEQYYNETYGGDL